MKEVGMKLLDNCLDALAKYLEYSQKFEMYIQGSIKEYFESIGGFEALIDLKSIENFEMYEKVSVILEKYYDDNYGELSNTDMVFT